MTPTDKEWVRSQIARNLDPVKNRIESVRKELADAIAALATEVDLRLDALESPAEPADPAPTSLPALVTCPEQGADNVAFLMLWYGKQLNLILMVDVESNAANVDAAVDAAKASGCEVWQYVPVFNGAPYYSPHADGYVVRCDWSNGPEHAIAALRHARETGKPVAALIDGRRHDKGQTTAPTFREVDPDGRPAWPFGRLADTDLHTHVRAILTALPGTPIVFWSCLTDWNSYHNRNGPDDQLVRSVIDYERGTVPAKDWLWQTFDEQVKVVRAAIDGKPCPTLWSIAPKTAPAEPPVVPPTGTLPIVEGMQLTNAGETKEYVGKHFKHSSEAVIRVKGGTTRLTDCIAEITNDDNYPLYADTAPNRIEAVRTKFIGGLPGPNPPRTQSCIRLFKTEGFFRDCSVEDDTNHTYRIHDGSHDLFIEGGSASGGGIAVGGAGVKNITFQRWTLVHTLTDFVKLEQGDGCHFDQCDLHTNDEKVMQFVELMRDAKSRGDTATYTNAERYACMNTFGDRDWQRSKGYIVATWANTRICGMPVRDYLG